MTKPRLTILLGAGSTANLGLGGPPRGMPSTMEITDAVRGMRLNEFTRAHGNHHKTVYVGKLPGDTAFAPSAERRLMSMFANKGDVERIWDDPDAQKFQSVGSLGVIASGVPMDDPTIEEAAKFLE